METINYIVDTSWMLHIGYHACRKVWPEHQGIHFLLKKLEAWLSNPNAKVFLCLDGTNIKGRTLLGEAYKANRIKASERSVYNGLRSFISLISNPRITVCFHNDYESDEVMYTLSRALAGKCVLVSGDKDLLQAVNENVSIEGTYGKVVTNENFETLYSKSFFGVTPERLPIYRAIVGDISDTLKPPVSRFPKKLAELIAMTVPYDGTCPSKETLTCFANQCPEKDKATIEKLILAYDDFALNFSVMKLNVISTDLAFFCNPFTIGIEEPLSDFLRSKINRVGLL